VPKIPGIRHQDAVKAFERCGFRVVRQSGHIVMSDGEKRLVIPRSKQINALTMGAIAADAGLSPEEFKKLL